MIEDRREDVDNRCVVFKSIYINNLRSTKINVLRVVLRGLKFRLNSQRF